VHKHGVFLFLLNILYSERTTTSEKDT